METPLCLGKRKRYMFAFRLLRINMGLKTSLTVGLVGVMPCLSRFTPPRLPALINWAPWPTPPALNGVPRVPGGGVSAGCEGWLGLWDGLGWVRSRKTS